MNKSQRELIMYASEINQWLAGRHPDCHLCESMLIDDLHSSNVLVVEVPEEQLDEWIVSEREKEREQSMMRQK